VNIQEYAWQILVNGSLLDKLGTPLKEDPSDLARPNSEFARAAKGGLSSFSVESFGRDELPALPQRNQEIAFQSHRTSKWKLPNRLQMERPEIRGELLHFFANHELLAIEAMAYAILRWGHQRERFCQDTYRVILQEQEHFRLYQGRMKELGVEFGALPRNDFFWRVIQQLDHFEQYLAVMPLTFEQANLDYAKHFQGLFSEIGDGASADIMQRVYLEEIGHVAQGVKHLLKTTNDQWAAYCHHLPSHVSPTRAVGLNFDESGRRRAGLGEEFIRKVYTFGKAYGRPGKLWIYDPDGEIRYWRSEGDGVLKAPGFFAQVKRDFSFLMTYLSQGHDAVAVEELPAENFVKHLRDLGLAMPFFSLQPFGNATSSAADHKHVNIGGLETWSGLGVQEQEALEAAHAGWHRKLSSKITAHEVGATLRPLWRELAIPLISDEDLGVVLRDQKELDAWIKQARFPLMLKEPLASSGRGNRVLWDLGGWTPAIRTWTDRVLHRSGGILVQRFFPKRYDLSLFFRPQNRTFSSQVLRPAFTRSQGSYYGHGLGSGFPLLPPQVTASLLYGRHQSLASYWQKIYQPLLDHLELLAKNQDLAPWRGPLGIDAMVVVDGDEIKVNPLLEFNPRWTMGAIARSLEPLIMAKAAGMFAVHDLQDLAPVDREMLEKRSPWLGELTVPTGSAVPKLKHGTLLLNPVTARTRFAAILQVAPSLDALRKDALQSKLEAPKALWCFSGPSDFLGL
jgi:uncharacterized ferritin-like protein (DUF455 family)